MRPGYKQTEVGVIPGDWRVKVLSDIALVIDGDRGANYPGNNDFSTDEHCLFLSARNVTKEGFRFGESYFITEEKDRSLGKGKLDRNDIVLTTRGTVGNLAFFNDSIPYSVIRINSGMVIIRNTDESLDTEYLYRVLRSQLVKTQIDRVVFGSAQPQLTVSVINRFQLPLPPTDKEQRAIVAALSDIDNLLAALDRLIAKKRAVKTGAMQQLLTGEVRVGEGGNGRWETKRLGEFGEFKGGNGFPTKYQGNKEGNYPFFKVSDMNNEGNTVFMRNSNNWISADVGKALSVKVFPKDTIIFAKIGAAIFLERKRILDKPSCIDNNLMGFIPSDRVHPAYMYHLFQTIELGRLVSTTALPSLSGKEIAELEFLFPDISEQRAIAAILADMDAEIAALGAIRAKTHALKQGMMQELLTGRTRLV